jgi:hypothetical protein
MKYFAGLLAIVALVAAATVGGYHLWDVTTRTRTGDDNGGVLAAGNAPPSATIPPDQAAPAQNQVHVTGTITSAHLEEAMVDPIPTPFTVNVPSRGGDSGATITGVEVKHKQVSIAWSSGQPLPVSGDSGSLLLAPITIDAAADGISIVLDTGVHGFTPGTYTLGSSVAVGDQPQDSVTFTATEQSTVTFRGGAFTPFDGVLAARGNGPAVLEGTFVVVRHDRTTATATSLTLDAGAYEITFTPGPNGVTIDATLQGSVH